MTPDTTVDAARLVSQLTDHAVIALDTSGNITSWNAGAERLKGYRAEQALGRNFSSFYTGEDRDRGLPFALLEQARENGSVKHSGWRVRQDGTRFWGDVVITALHDDDGGLAGYAKVTRDLTAQHDLEVALRRSEERFRTLVEQVTDYAIIALDASGTIESWNAGAQRVKHFTSEEAIGQHFSIFYSQSDKDDDLPLRLLAEARDAGQVQHTGWRIRRGGSRFWGDVVITALHDDHGTLTGYAKVTRDLTARKRFDDARETFLTTFAHDFRSPVTAVVGYAEMLATASPEESGRIAEKIAASARRLADMTTDLVDHTQLTVGGPIHAEALDLAEVVRCAVDSLAVDLDTDRVQVVVPELTLRSDRTSLERIVCHLVSNALRYSPDLSGVVVAAVAQDDRLRLAVSDRGRGIDDGDLQVIFNEFERGRLSTDDVGTGLGLASVRRLVKRLGGRVSIESDLGRGTTVTVDLPLVVG